MRGFLMSLFFFLGGLMALLGLSLLLLFLVAGDSDAEPRAAIPALRTEIR